MKIKNMTVKKRKKLTSPLPQPLAAKQKLSMLIPLIEQGHLRLLDGNNTISNNLNDCVVTIAKKKYCLVKPTQPMVLKDAEEEYEFQSILFDLFKRTKKGKAGLPMRALSTLYNHTPAEISHTMQLPNSQKTTQPASSPLP